MQEKATADVEVLRLKPFETRVQKHEKLIKLAEEGDVSPEAIDKLTKVTEELGLTSFEQLVEFIQKIGKATVSLIDKAGDTPADVDSNVAEQLLAYRAIGGTPADIEAVCNRANKIIESYLAIGSPQAITKTLQQANEALAAYVKIGGTQEQLKKVVTEHKELKTKTQAITVDEAAQKLSKEHGTELSFTRQVIKSAKNMSEAVVLLKAAKGKVESIKEGEEDPQNPDNLPPALSGTRSSRFFESVMPKTGRRVQSTSQLLEHHTK